MWNWYKSEGIIHANLFMPSYLPEWKVFAIFIKIKSQFLQLYWTGRVPLLLNAEWLNIGDWKCWLIKMPGACPRGGSLWTQTLIAGLTHWINKDDDFLDITTGNFFVLIPLKYSYWFRRRGHKKLTINPMLNSTFKQAPLLQWELPLQWEIVYVRAVSHGCVSVNLFTPNTAWARLWPQARRRLLDFHIKKSMLHDNWNIIFALFQ